MKPNAACLPRTLLEAAMCMHDETYPVACVEQVLQGMGGVEERTG